MQVFCKQGVSYCSLAASQQGQQLELHLWLLRQIMEVIKAFLTLCDSLIAAICVKICTPLWNHNSVKSEHTDMIHLCLDSVRLTL